MPLSALPSQCHQRHPGDERRHRRGRDDLYLHANGELPGDLSFDYQVSDDESPTPASSAVGTATVAIAAVNDAPVVSATASDTGNEELPRCHYFNR